MWHVTCGNAKGPPDPFSIRSMAWHRAFSDGLSSGVTAGLEFDTELDHLNMYCGLELTWAISGWAHAMVGGPDEFAGSFVGAALADFAFFFCFEEHRGKDKLGESVPHGVKVGQQCISKLEKNFTDIINLPREQVDSEAGKAFTAIRDFVKRLGSVITSKLIHLTLEQPDLKVEFELVPKDRRPLLHVVQVWKTVPEECQTLAAREHDWEYLGSKLGFFESLSLAFKEPVIHDNAFSDLREPCQQYIDLYLEQMGKALEGVGPSLSKDVESFRAKYEKVMDAAETWQLQSVDWMFDESGEAQTCFDLEAVRDNMDSLESQCQSLTAFIGHSTSHEGLAGMLAKALKFHKEGRALIKAASRVAGTMLVLGSILGASDLDGSLLQNQMGEVKSALKASEEEYGIKKADLPKGLQKVLEDSLAGRSVAVEPKKKPQRKRKADEDAGAAAEGHEKKSSKGTRAKKKEQEEKSEKKSKKVKK